MNNISVIMPTYNCGKYIVEAVESIVCQSVSVSEIIVVDDGSTDNTESILASYVKKGVVKYLKQKNQGPAAARNLGVKYAKGSWLAFLDADDVWIADKIKLQIACVERNKRIRFLSSKKIEYGENRNIPSSFDQSLREFSFEHLMAENYIGGPQAVVLEASLFREVGGFDERLKLCEDHELWIRIAEKTSLYMLNYPTVFFRKRNDSASLSNRQETFRKCKEFITYLYEEKYPRYKAKRNAALALLCFNSAVDAYDERRFKDSFNWIMNSFLYSPFFLPLISSVRLPRLRKLRVILSEIVFSKLK